MIEARAKVRDALRHEQVVEGSHFGFVVRTARDLVRAIRAELAITGVAEARAYEARRDAAPFLFGLLRIQAVDYKVGLAVVAPRCARVR